MDREEICSLVTANLTRIVAEARGGQNPEMGIVILAQRRRRQPPWQKNWFSTRAPRYSVAKQMSHHTDETLRSAFQSAPSLAVVQFHLRFLLRIIRRDALLAFRGLPEALNFPLSASSLLVTLTCEDPELFKVDLPGRREVG